MTEVKAGSYIGPGGEPAEPGTPLAVVCRRLRDYAPAPLPPEPFGITACAQCRFAVVFNPNGPHQDRPKVCMQCAGIEPLPLEKGSRAGE